MNNKDILLLAELITIYISFLISENYLESVSVWHLYEWFIINFNEIIKIYIHQFLFFFMLFGNWTEYFRGFR